MVHARIDVHQHIVPPAYAEWLRSKGIRDAGGRELPRWSVEDALRLMDDQDIATAVLSLSTPGVHLDARTVRDSVARAKAREVNELAAGVARDHPARFGFFATLPLPDVDGALDDLARFYFDTALSGSPAALPSLLAFAKPGHVLFGSDWPYAPPIAVSYFTGQLDAYAALAADGHAAIDRRSAEALLPQFAVRVG